MSKIKSLILSNPKLAAKFMTGMSAEYWEKQGRAKALATFRTASNQVPAYKAFLTDRGFDPASVRSFEDFATIPTTDKDNYLAGQPLDRLITGKVSDAHLLYMSGGTTGGSLIGAADRGTLRAFPPSLAAMLDFNWGICDPNIRVLAINAMSLGAWIAGNFATVIFQQASDRWPNMTFMNPGADAPRLLDMVEAVSAHYDMLLLISYPTFVKEVLNAGRERGIDWKASAVKVIVAGERLDMKLRREIETMISDPVDHHAIMDWYGASEMCNFGAETPLASTIIRLASENVALSRDIFGTDEPRSLVQNNPLGTFAEVIDDRILGTAGSLMPVVRYSPKDLGRLVRFDDMLRMIRDHRIDLAMSLAEDGWTKPLFKWPFLSVHGRADHAVSIFGAKVSPQSIQDLFATDPRIQGFRLGVDEDGPYAVMTLDLELVQGLELDEDARRTVESHYSASVLQRLLERDIDYRDAHSIHPEAAVPRVRAHDRGTGVFAQDAASFKPKSL